MLPMDWKPGFMSLTCLIWIGDLKLHLLQKSLVICHEPLSLLSAQISPFLHNLNRIDPLGFVSPCLALTHFKQLKMNVALLLVGKLCLILPKKIFPWCVAPFPASALSSRCVVPPAQHKVSAQEHLPTFTQPGSQLCSPLLCTR